MKHIPICWPCASSALCRHAQRFGQRSQGRGLGRANSTGGTELAVSSTVQTKISTFWVSFFPK
eukprot:3829097-Amphidinium_carterae.1